MLKVFSALLNGNYAANGFTVVAAKDRAQAWELTQTTFDSRDGIDCEEEALEELVGVKATGKPRILVNHMNAY